MSNFFGITFSSLFILSCASCQQREPQHPQSSGASFQLISEIPVPGGYKRVKTDSNSFGDWLRNTRLKKDTHVYLYDGTLKHNQSAQFAVLDIPVGNKDLQQCADAVMRLRAEYLFSKKRYDEIAFADNNGRIFKWQGGSDKTGFEKYLEQVFSWCGTASLEKHLNIVRSVNDIKPGDIFIKGGSPGHAMIVIDVAVNDEGKKIFMLAQSYMPAQDIHIVKNPLNEKLSPWYEINAEDITTPEWIFKKDQLREW